MRKVTTPADFREIQSVWSSYAGHLRHASSRRLLSRLHARFPWLSAATVPRTFDYRLEGRAVAIRYGI